MTDKSDVPDSGKDSSYPRSYERRQKRKKLTNPPLLVRCVNSPYLSPLRYIGFDSQPRCDWNFANFEFIYGLFSQKWTSRASCEVCRGGNGAEVLVGMKRVNLVTRTVPYFELGWVKFSTQQLICQSPYQYVMWWPSITVSACKEDQSRPCLKPNTQRTLRAVRFR